MDNRIRRGFFLISVGLVLVLILLIFNEDKTLGTDAMRYYLQNFKLETGADNAVAAIYLNYRVFDTFFEALLLMISVTGIIYFLEEKGHDDTK